MAAEVLTKAPGRRLPQLGLRAAGIKQAPAGAAKPVAPATQGKQIWDAFSKSISSPAQAARALTDADRNAALAYGRAQVVLPSTRDKQFLAALERTTPITPSVAAQAPAPKPVAPAPGGELSVIKAEPQTVNIDAEIAENAAKSPSDNPLEIFSF